jgi:hypothetical protein
LPGREVQQHGQLVQLQAVHLANDLQSGPVAVAISQEG